MELLSPELKRLVFLFEIGAWLHDLGKMHRNFQDHEYILRQQRDGLRDQTAPGTWAFYTELFYLHAPFGKLYDGATLPAGHSFVAWASDVDTPLHVIERHGEARHQQRGWVQTAILADAATSGDDRRLEGKPALMGPHQQPLGNLTFVADAFGAERRIPLDLLDTLRRGTNLYEPGTLYGALRDLEGTPLVRALQAVVAQLKACNVPVDPNFQDQVAQVLQAAPVEHIVALREEVVNALDCFFRQHSRYDEDPEQNGRPIAATWRPVNDITLWDHSRAVAAWAKCFIAHVALGDLLPVWNLTSNQWQASNLLDELNVYVALAGIKLNVREWLRTAHNSGDLAGRRIVAEKARKALVRLFENDLAVGNCLYQDDHRLVFLLPNQLRDDKRRRADVQGAVDECLRKVWQQEVGDDKVVGLMATTVAVPTRTVSEQLPGLLNELSVASTSLPFPSQTALNKLWEAAKASGDSHELCPVCRQRPMKVRRPTAPVREEYRQTCHTCSILREKGYHQREERIGQTDVGTVWTGQVADHPGEPEKRRLALLLLHVPLHGWLDGSLIHAQQFWYQPPDPSDPDQGELYQKALAERPPRKTPSYERLSRVLNNVSEWIGEVRQLCVDHLRPRAGVGLLFHVPGFPGPEDFYEVEFPSLLPGKRLPCLNYPAPQSYEFSLADALPLEAIVPLKEEERTSENLQGRLEIVQEGLLQLEEVKIYPEGSREPLLAPNGTSAWKIDPVPGAKVGPKEVNLYLPYTEILRTPQTLALLVPADAAWDLAVQIEQDFHRRFPKATGKLAPCLGLLYAGHKFPLYVLLDTMYDLLADFDRPEHFWERARVTQTRSFDNPACPGKGILSVQDPVFAVRRDLEIDGRLRDHNTGDLRAIAPFDRYYTRYLVVGCQDGFPPYCQEDVEVPGQGKVACTVVPFERVEEDEKSQNGQLPDGRTVQEGDELLLTFGRLEFRRLTAASQRFATPEELYYTGKPPRFDDLAAFARMWELLHAAGLTRTQLRGLHALLDTKAQEWGLASEEYRQLAKMALQDTLPSSGPRRLPDEDFQFLLARALNGQFFDFVNFFETVARRDWEERKRRDT